MRVPEFSGRYFEPFLGGGAFFFALSSARPGLVSHLNDLNSDLVLTYTIVRDRLAQLVEVLGDLEARYLEQDPEGRARMYYAVRRDRPTDSVPAAARVIFLNKTCFNGLYRVNRSGAFNVPHGRYPRPRICDSNRLRAASECLQSAELDSDDFVAATAAARDGDLVYFDPPYHPLTPTSSFTSYTDKDFGEDDQVRLRDCIDTLTARGAHVLISNSSHPWIVDLYKSSGYDVSRVEAARAINSRGDRRGPIEELVISNEGQLNRRQR